MSQAPLVSVLCTAFQHEKYIADALDGFLMQRTDFPFEVIVHDDASTDGTPGIIRRYAGLHPGIIRPIYQVENQFSTAPGRITAIINEAARGEFIALCEGDDYWTDPLKLQKQVDLLRQNPTAGGCFHFTEQVFEGVQGQGRLFGSHDGRTRFGVADTFSAYSLCHNTAFMYRKEAFPVPAWLGRVRSGDMVLFSVVAGWGDLLCIPEVMSVYRKHEAGVTTAHARAPREFHKARILLMDLLDEHHQYRFHQEAERIKRIHQAELDKLAPSRSMNVIDRFANKLRSLWAGK